MAIESCFGKLPATWEITTLGDVCKRGGGLIQTGPFGSQLHSSDYVDKGIPTIMPQNLGDNQVIEQDISRITEKDAQRLSKYRVIPGDIVYSRRGDVTRRALIRDEQNGWLCGTGSLMVRLGKGIADPKYVSYFLGDPRTREWIQRHAVGATMPNLNTSIMGAVPFINPPLPEQRAIAGILGALDDKTELNRRMNQTLESMARAMFRQWFVDGEESTYWEVGRLGDFIGVNERSITKDYSHNEIEYVDISSVAIGHLEGTTTYALKAAPSRAKRLVHHGDTIWSTVRPNRRSYLFISNPKANLVVSTGFAVLTPKKLPASFIYFFTTTEQFVDHLVSNADGSAYPAVLPERFADAEFSIPPEHLLRKFEDMAGPMLEQIAHNERESRTLASLRDTLLPKLMRGEVRVAMQDVEKEI